MQLSIKVVYDSKFSGIIFDEPKMLTLSAFRTRIAARIGITNAEKLDRMCLVYRDYDGENTVRDPPPLPLCVLIHTDHHGRGSQMARSSGAQRD